MKGIAAALSIAVVQPAFTAFATAATVAAAAQESPRPAATVDVAAVRKAIQQLRRGQDVEENLALLRAAVDQVPDAGSFARDVGTLLLNEKLYEPAQGFLEIARERLPQDGVVAQQLGNAHVMQHHYAEAHEHLSAADRLLPPGLRPYVHLYLSMVLIGLQKAEESEARAKRAIEEVRAWNAAQPPGAPRLDEIDFELNLANVYQRFLRADDALRVLDALDGRPMEQRDLAKSRLVRAQILEARGDDAGALAAFARQRELAPDDAAGAYEFALYHVRRNRPAEARPLLERATKLDPEHEGAHFNLARVLLRLGEKEQGEAVMARYHAIHGARISAEVRLAEMRLRLRARPAR